MRMTAQVGMVAGLATLGLLAGSANAALFSFASDTNQTDFTFAGFGNQVSDAQDPTDPVVLLVDDDNGPLPALAFNVEFDADFTIQHRGSTQIAPGIFTHSYRLDGTYQFSNATGVLLRVTIAEGAMVALGQQATWGSTDTILGSDDPGSVTYEWFGGDLPGYGVFNGTSIGNDDAAFTLTFLQTAAGLGVGLDANFLPNNEWKSEGSYSGTAFFVPAPGALALLGAAGLVARRRR